MSSYQCKSKLQGRAVGGDRCHGLKVRQLTLVTSANPQLLEETRADCYDKIDGVVSPYNGNNVSIRAHYNG